MLKYTITAIPSVTPADLFSGARAVNESASVVGFAYQSGGGFGYQATRWSGGLASQLLVAQQEPFPHGQNLAYAINDAADVVGILDIPSARAFFYSQIDGKLHDLSSIVGGAQSSANDVNNLGVVAGTTGGIATGQPFIYDAKGGGQVTILDPLPGHAMAGASGVNDAGHVVGVSQAADFGDGHIFLVRDGETENLGSGSASAINANDVTTGYRWPTGFPIAFRLDASGATPVFEDLQNPDPSFAWSEGFAINDDGVIVGFSNNAEEDDQRAFVHVPAGPDAGWHDLQDHVIDADGWVLNWAYGINNNGDIVGTGTYQGSRKGFLLRPYAPDPFGWLKKKDLDAMLVALLELGGAPVGASGTVVLPGGKPIPIDPHGPARLRWEQMSEAERDLYLGFAMRGLGRLLGDERAKLLERAAADVINSALKELEQGQR